MSDQFVNRAAAGNNGEHIAGYHLLIDASGCDLLRIGSDENLREFIVALEHCLAISTQGKPTIQRYAVRSRSDSSWSLAQMSRPASISAHFFEIGGVACIDIFLTRPFDVDAVRAVIERYFLPVSTRLTCVNRSFSDARRETS